MPKCNMCPFWPWAELSAKLGDPSRLCVLDQNWHQPEDAMRDTCTNLFHEVRELANTGIAMWEERDDG